MILLWYILYCIQYHDIFHNRWNIPKRSKKLNRWKSQVATWKTPAFGAQVTAQSTFQILMSSTSFIASIRFLSVFISRVSLEFSLLTISFNVKTPYCSIYCIYILYVVAIPSAPIPRCTSLWLDRQWVGSRLGCNIRDTHDFSCHMTQKFFLALSLWGVRLRNP